MYQIRLEDMLVYTLYSQDTPTTLLMIYSNHALGPNEYEF